MKKSIAIILTICLALFLPANTSFAKKDSNVSKCLEVEATYQTPDDNAIDNVVLTADEANTLSEKEIVELIKNRAKSDDVQAKHMLTLARQAKSAAVSSDSASVMATAHTHSGIPFTSYSEWGWYVNPHLLKTEKWITYSNAWIGVDAYTSAVGKKRGSVTELSTSTSIGFSGFEAILKFCNFEWGQGETSTSSISTEFECPAWTTYNERPYILYWKDYWEGIWCRKWYDVWFDGCVTYQSMDSSSIKTGENNRLYVKTEQLWSRVNEYHILSLATPLPPTGQPPVSW